ncbi:MAG TPA: hypothetical protein PKD73_18250, partial [Burkholderiaceae bacterium]|nr:hypothetical protein [Burkholderiaceae bacterium]
MFYSSKMPSKKPLKAGIENAATGKLLIYLQNYLKQAIQMAFLPAFSRSNQPTVPENRPPTVIKPGVPPVPAAG